MHITDRVKHLLWNIVIYFIFNQKQKRVHPIQFQEVIKM